MVTGRGHFGRSVLQYVYVCVCLLVTDLSVGGGCGLCVEVVLSSCMCACRLQSCVQ